MNLKIAKIFQTSHSRFHLIVGLKVLAIALFSTLFVLFVYWTFLANNYLFFQANGYERIENLKEAFYDYIFSETLSFLPFLALFYISLFFVGSYLGSLLLRPFKKIAQHCHSIETDQFEVSYKSDLFSELKLLTNFSELFFYYVNQVKAKKILGPSVVPPIYSQIRGPVFEKQFFFHFLLITIIICVGVSTFIFNIALILREKLILLGADTLLDRDGSVSRYLVSQGDLFETTLWISIGIEGLLYLWLAINLYSSVSMPAFGIFATMRTFMKGNFSARIHLIGFAHLREYTKEINSFLDYLETNYLSDTKDKMARPFTKNNKHDQH